MKPIMPSENETHLGCGHLLDEAERLLEQNDFAASVAAFREAALLAPLTQGTLLNLSVAEENDRIESRKRMTRMFPSHWTSRWRKSRR